MLPAALHRFLDSAFDLARNDSFGVMNPRGNGGNRPRRPLAGRLATLPVSRRPGRGEGLSEFICVICGFLAGGGQVEIPNSELPIASYGGHIRGHV